MKKHFLEVCFSRLVRCTSQWIKLECMNVDESKVFFFRGDNFKYFRSKTVINLKVLSLCNDSRRGGNLFWYAFSLPPICKSTKQIHRLPQIEMFLFSSCVTQKLQPKHAERLGLCNNLQFCLPSTFTYKFMISIYEGMSSVARENQMKNHCWYLIFKRPQ